MCYNELLFSFGTVWEVDEEEEFEDGPDDGEGLTTQQVNDLDLSWHARLLSLSCAISLPR